MARDPGGRRHAHTLDAQARDLVAFPTSAAKAAVRCPRVRADVPPQTVQRYRQRRPHFVGNEPWPTMVRPSFPRVSHPRLAQAIPSIACIAHVYLGGTRGFRPRSPEVKATDQQRPAQAPECEPAAAVLSEQSVNNMLPTTG